MRKSLWVILAVLFAAIGAPNALADSYTSATLFFDGPEGSVPTGSFVYDNTTNEFTSFPVSVQGVGFPYDHTTFTADNIVYVNNFPSCSGSTCPLEEALFHMLVGIDGKGGGTFDWSVGFASASGNAIFDAGFDLAGVEVINLTVCCGTNASGTFTVVTPEPSTSILLMLGIGFLISIARRRIVQNIPRVA